MSSSTQERGVSADRGQRSSEPVAPAPAPGLTAEMGTQSASQQTRTMVQMLRRNLPPGAAAGAASPSGDPVQMEGEGEGTKTPLQALDEALTANDAGALQSAWSSLKAEDITTLKADQGKSKRVVALLATASADRAFTAAWALSDATIDAHVALVDAAWSDGIAQKTVDAASAAQQDELVRKHWAKLSGLMAGKTTQAVLTKLAADSNLFLQCVVDVADFRAATDKYEALKTAVAAPNAAAAVAIWDAGDPGLPGKLLADLPTAAAAVALIKGTDANKAWAVVTATWTDSNAATLMTICASAWDADFAGRVVAATDAAQQNALVQANIAQFICLQPRPAHEVFAQLYTNKADFVARYKDTPDFQAWADKLKAFEAAMEVPDQDAMHHAWVNMNVDQYRAAYPASLKTRAAMGAIIAKEGAAKAEEWSHWLCTNFGAFPNDYFTMLESVWGPVYEPMALARFTTIDLQEGVARNNLARFPTTIATQSVDVALPLLHADADRFASCYSGVPDFMNWADRDNLGPALSAAPNAGWRSKVLTTLKALGFTNKLVSFLRPRAGDANWRDAVVVQAQMYGWLLQQLGAPVGSDADADMIKALYADGTGVGTADRLKTYSSLYTATLLQSGSVHRTPVDSQPQPTGGTDDYDTSFKAVTPNDEALGVMLTQFGLLPRVQVNLASQVVMATEKADRVVVRRPAGTWTYYLDIAGEYQWTNDPIWVTLDTSYYYSDGTFVLYTAAGRPGFGDMSQARNRMSHAGTDGSGSAYTYFKNHCHHEIGHAVGAKTLAGFGKPDDVIEAGAGWVDSDAATFAEQYGLNAGLIGANYAMRKDRTSPQKNISGADIADFLQKYLFGEGTAGCRICTELDVDGDTAFGLIQTSTSTAAIAATPYVDEVIGRLRGKDKGSWYELPVAPTAVGGKVTLYSTRCGNKWMKFKDSYYTNRVSEYGVSSFKEMFAELYTAHYSSQGIGGGMPEASALFTGLDGADSADFT